MVVNARGADVGVAEPLLHLGDVRLVVERVGGAVARSACAPISKPSIAAARPLEGGGRPLFVTICRKAR